MVRARAIVVAAALLAASACSDGGGDGATGDRAGAAGDRAAVVAQRWGAGRALEARVAPGTATTVVATTVGALVHDGDAAPVVLGDGPDATASRLTISADGTTAAFVRGDASVAEVWDLSAAELILEVPLDDGGGTPFELSAASDAVLTTGPAGLVRTPLDGGEPEVLVAPADGGLGVPVVSPVDGAVAVSGTGGPQPTAVVWRPDRGAHELSLTLADGDSIGGVRWSPDGAHLAVVVTPAARPFEADVIVWDVGADIETTTVTSEVGVEAGAVAFQGPDRLVIAEGGQLVAHDLSGAEVGHTAEIGDDERSVQSVTAVPGAASVVVVGRDGQVLVWSAGQEPIEIRVPGSSLIDASVEVDGRHLVVVDFDGAVQRIDLADGSMVAEIDRYALGAINSVDVSADGGLVAMATTTGAVRTVAVADGAPVGAFDRPQGNVDSVEFAPDTTAVATGVSVRRGAEAFDDSVAVTATASGEPRLEFGGEAEEVPGCATFRNEVHFSPDGRVLAANSHDFAVQLWSLDGAAPLHVFTPHLGAVLDLAFSPDGSLLATSSEDGTLRLWDLDDLTLRAEHPAAIGGYWTLTFSPDGETLAVADLAGEISLVDVDSGEVDAVIEGRKSRVGNLAFSPDGSLLVAPGEGNDVAVWSVEEGRVVERFDGHTAPALSVDVTPDGSAVVSGGRDGTVRYWPLHV